MTLFQLLLIAGVVNCVLSETRYYLIQNKKNWNDAKSYCRAKYIDLAVIKSTDDMIQLQKEAQSQGFNSEAWIGLYNDMNSWRWSYNNTTLGFEYWNSGQPNNYGGHSECAVAGWLGWPGWDDIPCNMLKSTVCFDARYTNTGRYIYISTPQMSWHDAQSYCREHYTDLAIIEDATESSALANILPSNTAWIGLFRDSWKWINETSMSNIMWSPGKPDNLQTNENCAFIYNGQASDAQCSNTKSFFCYSDTENTRRMQTIRVKIQAEENVNDPAVKAAILEKIKEKLMEKGVAENTTMKWIVQPDGVVFHKEECNKTQNNGTEN